MSVEFSEAVQLPAVVAGRAADRNWSSDRRADVVAVVPNRRLSLGYQFAKRTLDIVVSVVVMILLAPLFLMIAAAIVLSSRGPAFYRSRRIGQGGKSIQFLKFRTMYTGADKVKTDLLHLNEQNGPIFKIKNDPRITPLGAILRKYSLDELPQFIHVLKGEMTLVGPRPHLPCEVEHYQAEHMQRLTVKPGLTCYWQVKGRSDLSFEEWMDLDLKYVEDMNFMLDLKLLAQTPGAVLKGKGAY